MSWGQGLSVVGQEASRNGTLRRMAKMGRPARQPDELELMALMGERLRWVREALGASQEAMAELVGVHQTAWSYYERGLRWPDEFSATKLISKLRISSHSRHLD